VQPIDLILLQKFENLSTFVLRGSIVTDSPNTSILPELEELSLNEVELADKDIPNQHKTMIKFNKVKKLIFNTYEFDAEILLEELDIDFHFAMTSGRAFNLLRAGSSKRTSMFLTLAPSTVSVTTHDTPKRLTRKQKR
jgi:hypothetical protein